MSTAVSPVHMSAHADRVRNRRQGFAAPGGFHDRLIRFLKAALPMGIGVLAAFMIITPLAPRGEISFLLDRNKVALANDRLRVDDAMYRGNDDEGRPFSVTAGEAVQHRASEPIVRMQQLVARILLSGGPAQLSAGGGNYDIDSDRIAVDDAVRFTAADGYRLVARGVDVDLRNKTVVGRGRVDGAIPAGTFSADRIRADLEARTITLDGNARLRMVPGQLRMPK